MSALSHWRKRWGLLAVIAALVVIVSLFGVMHQRDSAVARAVSQLQPGMTDAEVQQILEPVRNARLASRKGADAYVFYGIDEFVTVVMERDGEASRVARV